MSDSSTPVRPEVFEFPVAGGALNVLRWPAPGRPVLLFAHANGFNARTYTRLFAPLAGQYDIVAPDLRGHGLSTAPADPATHRDWYGYAADLTALAAAVSDDPVLLAGHSMGGVSAILAAGQAGLPVRGIALIEPVLMPRPFYWIAHLPGGSGLMKHTPLYKGARKRKADWPDHDTAAQRYGRKSLFAGWADGVLADYLEDGLVPTDDGLTLSCSPAWEAANFASHRHDVWGALRRISTPVRVLKGTRRDSTVRVAGALERAGVAVDRMDGAGHLIPQTHPLACAVWIDNWARAQAG